MDQNISPTIISAVAEDGSIGFRGGLPWGLPYELKHFKEVTQGGVLIVGRKTAETLPTLPGRIIVVVTRYPNENRSLGNHQANSLESALWASSTLHPGKRVWVAGGSIIYSQALQQCSTMVISRIKGTYTADTYFPEISHPWVKLRETEKLGFTVEDWVRLNK